MEQERPFNHGSVYEKQNEDVVRVDQNEIHSKDCNKQNKVNISDNIEAQNYVVSNPNVNKGQIGCVQHVDKTQNAQQHHVDIKQFNVSNQSPKGQHNVANEVSSQTQIETAQKQSDATLPRKRNNQLVNVTNSNEQKRPKPLQHDLTNYFSVKKQQPRKEPIIVNANAQNNSNKENNPKLSKYQIQKAKQYSEPCFNKYHIPNIQFDKPKDSNKIIQIGQQPTTQEFEQMAANRTDWDETRLNLDHFKYHFLEQVDIYQKVHLEKKKAIRLAKEDSRLRKRDKGRLAYADFYQNIVQNVEKYFSYKSFEDQQSWIHHFQNVRLLKIYTQKLEETGKGIKCFSQRDIPPYIQDRWLYLNMSSKERSDDSFVLNKLIPLLEGWIAKFKSSKFLSGKVTIYNPEDFEITKESICTQEQINTQNRIKELIQKIRVQDKLANNIQDSNLSNSTQPKTIMPSIVQVSQTQQSQENQLFGYCGDDNQNDLEDIEQNIQTPIPSQTNIQDAQYEIIRQTDIDYFKQREQVQLASRSKTATKTSKHQQQSSIEIASVQKQLFKQKEANQIETVANLEADDVQRQSNSRVQAVSQQSQDIMAMDNPIIDSYTNTISQSYHQNLTNDFEGDDSQSSSAQSRSRQEIVDKQIQQVGEQIQSTQSIWEELQEDEVVITFNMLLSHRHFECDNYYISLMYFKRLKEEYSLQTPTNFLTYIMKTLRVQGKERSEVSEIFQKDMGEKVQVVSKDKVKQASQYMTNVALEINEQDDYKGWLATIQKNWDAKMHQQNQKNPNRQIFKQYQNKLKVPRSVQKKQDFVQLFELIINVKLRDIAGVEHIYTNIKLKDLTNVQYLEIPYQFLYPDTNFKRCRSTLPVGCIPCRRTIKLSSIETLEQMRQKLVKHVISDLHKSRVDSLLSAVKLLEFCKAKQINDIADFIKVVHDQGTKRQREINHVRLSKHAISKLKLQEEVVPSTQPTQTQTETQGQVDIQASQSRIHCINPEELGIPCKVRQYKIFVDHNLQSSNFGKKYYVDSYKLRENCSQPTQFTFSKRSHYSFFIDKILNSVWGEVKSQAQDARQFVSSACQGFSNITLTQWHPTTQFWQISEMQMEKIYEEGWHIADSQMQIIKYLEDRSTNISKLIKTGVPIIVYYGYCFRSPFCQIESLTDGPCDACQYSNEEAKKRSHGLQYNPYLEIVSLQSDLIKHQNIQRNCAYKISRHYDCYDEDLRQLFTQENSTTSQNDNICQYKESDKNQQDYLIDSIGLSSGNKNPVHPQEKKSQLNDSLGPSSHIKQTVQLCQKTRTISQPANSFVIQNSADYSEQQSIDHSDSMSSSNSSIRTVNVAYKEQQAAQRIRQGKKQLAIKCDALKNTRVNDLVYKQMAVATKRTLQKDRICKKYQKTTFRLQNINTYQQAQKYLASLSIKHDPVMQIIDLLLHCYNERIINNNDQFIQFVHDTLESKKSWVYSERQIQFYHTIMQLGGPQVADQVAGCLKGPSISVLKNYRRKHRSDFTPGVDEDKLILTIMHAKETFNQLGIDISIEPCIVAEDSTSLQQFLQARVYKIAQSQQNNDQHNEEVATSNINVQYVVYVSGLCRGRIQVVSLAEIAEIADTGMLAKQVHVYCLTPLTQKTIAVPIALFFHDSSSETISSTIVQNNWIAITLACAGIGVNLNIRTADGASYNRNACYNEYLINKARPLLDVVPNLGLLNQTTKELPKERFNNDVGGIFQEYHEDLKQANLNLRECYKTKQKSKEETNVIFLQGEEQQSIQVSTQASKLQSSVSQFKVNKLVIFIQQLYHLFQHVPQLVIFPSFYASTFTIFIPDFVHLMWRLRTPILDAKKDIKVGNEFQINAHQLWRYFKYNKDNNIQLTAQDLDFHNKQDNKATYRLFHFIKEKIDEKKPQVKVKRKKTAAQRSKKARKEVRKFRAEQTQKKIFAGVRFVQNTDFMQDLKNQYSESWGLYLYTNFVHKFLAVYLMGESMSTSEILENCSYVITFISTWYQIQRQLHQNSQKEVNDSEHENELSKACLNSKTIHDVIVACNSIIYITCNQIYMDDRKDTITYFNRLSSRWVEYIFSFMRSSSLSNNMLTAESAIDLLNLVELQNKAAVQTKELNRPNRSRYTKEMGDEGTQLQRHTFREIQKFIQQGQTNAICDLSTEVMISPSTNFQCNAFYGLSSEQVRNILSITRDPKGIQSLFSNFTETSSNDKFEFGANEEDEAHEQELYKQFKLQMYGNDNIVKQQKNLAQQQKPRQQNTQSSKVKPKQFISKRGRKSSKASVNSESEDSLTQNSQQFSLQLSNVEDSDIDKYVIENPELRLLYDTITQMKQDNQDYKHQLNEINKQRQQTNESQVSQAEITLYNKILKLKYDIQYQELRLEKFIAEKVSSLQEPNDFVNNEYLADLVTQGKYDVSEAQEQRQDQNIQEVMKPREGKMTRYATQVYEQQLQVQAQVPIQNQIPNTNDNWNKKRYQNCTLAHVSSQAQKVNQEKAESYNIQSQQSFKKCQGHHENAAQYNKYVEFIKVASLIFRARNSKYKKNYEYLLKKFENDRKYFFDKIDDTTETLLQNDDIIAVVYANQQRFEYEHIIGRVEKMYRQWGHRQDVVYTVDTSSKNVEFKLRLYEVIQQGEKEVMSKESCKQLLSSSNAKRLKMTINKQLSQKTQVVPIYIKDKLIYIRPIYGYGKAKYRTYKMENFLLKYYTAANSIIALSIRENRLLDSYPQVQVINNDELTVGEDEYEQAERCITRNNVRYKKDKNPRNFKANILGERDVYKQTEFDDILGQGTSSTQEQQQQ